MERVLFRPFMETPEDYQVPGVYRQMKSPLFAWIGLRPVFAQHTLAEDRALQTQAKGRQTVVEIGVAEGGSALALRNALPSDSTLYLIDPYHLSRFQWINSPRRVAHAVLRRGSWGRRKAEKTRVNVVWIQEFSFDACRTWNKEIDFLFLDGDHNESAVWRDWQDWHRFVVPGGIVAFHDARVFPGGWSLPSDGPVRVVDALFRQKTIEGWMIVEETHSLVFVERLK
jgi:predicted O-methyltransferase YrrM